MTSHLSPILTLRKKIMFRSFKTILCFCDLDWLALNFLILSHSAWVFAGELAMDHVRFYKGEYNFISHFYLQKKQQQRSRVIKVI